MKEARTIDDSLDALQDALDEIERLRADRLAVAVRAAKAMQEECVNAECWLCREGHERVDQKWHRWGAATMLACHAIVLREQDTIAVARRAVEDAP